ncbi:glycogen debranching N-terminal domain-containing protein [Pseudarthrobacter sp. J75]|uniref:amylo-alpha-1,6-glucosidase n=1 Tax=unclassified Pseudarthrobacter TaxID=2647000 RepID=UPI002E80FEE7|nr:MULTISPECIES: glycogen debranching N-terminal domain-containing protein [unclassified Pseudarthrobacter]MEE2522563.1 glycogen debranching N-terminal domain-containing protein [Pseudarthrobacter sp. J47]MEE2529092.1 glycogen debranching N-terminal domain-containing protein [Pseudarthrobacter sp. J75]
MTAWNADTEAAATESGAMTVVEGSSFCISSGTGDIAADGGTNGAFYQDTRIISRWVLRINDSLREPLGAQRPESYRAVFVGRARWPGGRFDSPLVVRQERHVGPGLQDDITLENYSSEPVDCDIELLLDADQADLFDVKGGRVAKSATVNRTVREGELVLEAVRNGQRRGTAIRARGAFATESSLRFRASIPARGQWSTSIIVVPLINGEPPAEPFTEATRPQHRTGARRHRDWEQAVPRITVTDSNVQNVLDRSQRDLGSLRIFDSHHRDRAAVAAGAPWFMALFGRDSLISSYMSLMVDPGLATGTLQTLAGLQGKVVDPDSEEEPGRIPHEVRLGITAGLSLGGTAYYGTADATPLFVSLLGELSRWGLTDDVIDALLPHADRAMEWIEEYGDRDGDGFVEYQRPNPHGLINQGWKDSWDGINFADGRIAEPPIALCEVQAYVYSAYVGRSRLARCAGDVATERHWAAKAAALKRAFNEQFWLPDKGYFALALDKDKTPVDSCTSNMGHCLWTGIADADKAPAVAARLMEPDMFTGWGIRTLASTMGAYNPVSYHNGSVWPHDTALVATGLMRYGFVEEASRVASALFSAASHFDGRLPELFCGFDHTEFPGPVPYPTACSPQAWAAAAPVQLARILLRFDPDFTRGVVHLAPILPDSMGDFRAENVHLGHARVVVEARDHEGLLTGLPDRLEMIREPRPPLDQDLAVGEPVQGS